jgi:hypothetical protein
VITDFDLLPTKIDFMIFATHGKILAGRDFTYGKNHGIQAQFLNV